MASIFLYLSRPNFGNNSTKNSEKFYLKEVSEEEKIKFDYEDKLLKYTRQFLSDNSVNMYGQRAIESNRLS
jgi:hypothetical protein